MAKKSIEGLAGAEVKAIAALVSDAMAKKASEGMSVGDHVIDFKVHVTGVLSKGEDYDQRVVAKADPWLLLAVALSHLNGVTVESIVREAVDASPEMAEGIKDKASEAIQVVKATTWTTVPGKVVGVLSAVKV